MKKILCLCSFLALLGPVFVHAQPTGFTVVTPIAKITQLPTAIPTAYGTPQFVNSTSLRSITIYNGFDQPVDCQYGAPVTPIAPFRVPANSAYTSNFGSRNQVMQTHIGCIRTGSTPASGTLEIWGEK